MQYFKKAFIEFINNLDDSANIRGGHNRGIGCGVGGSPTFLLITENDISN